MRDGNFATYYQGHSTSHLQRTENCRSLFLSREQLQSVVHPEGYGHTCTVRFVRMEGTASKLNCITCLKIKLNWTGMMIVVSVEVNAVDSGGKY